MLSEGNKSGDNSLRDWFSKSKSSDGTPGWVQLGGKYAGKPCARQPGQTTKPKCGSSKMKRNLSKDEEEAAFRRKNRQDPNPDRKGKAKNVATEETINEKEGKKDACYHKVKSRYSVWPSAYASGALVKCRKKGAKNWGKVAKSIKKEEFTPVQIKALESIGALEVNEEGQKCWKGYEKKGTKKMFGKTYNNCVKKEEFVNEGCGCDEKCSKCGKSPCECGTKKYRGGDAGKPGPDKNYVKPMGEQTIELTDAYGNKFAEIENIIEPEPIKTVQNNIEYKTYDIESMTEATRVASKTGNIIMVTLTWKGKLYGLKMFFPQITKPSRSDVQDQIEKVYPGSRLNSFYVSEVKPGENFLQVAEGAAWTKKAGKSESGGLNEKGRKSYERENPGSDLKAPSKKVGNPRRKSFCARMRGMRKRQKPSNNTGEDRLSKSLRAWNC